jgi:hypothetical protein
MLDMSELLQVKYMYSVQLERARLEYIQHIRTDVHRHATFADPGNGRWRPSSLANVAMEKVSPV